MAMRQSYQVAKDAGRRQSQSLWSLLRMAAEWFAHIREGKKECIFTQHPQGGNHLTATIYASHPSLFSKTFVLRYFSSLSPSSVQPCR